MSDRDFHNHFVLTISSFVFRFNSRQNAAYIALYREIDEVKALEFMTMVCTGIGITNNTVYALRSKLIESRIDKSHTIVPEAKNALIIKAWNAWRIGKSTNRIKYIVGDETFPIAI